MTNLNVTIAELFVELAETFEARGNHQRSLINPRIVRSKHYHEGKADGHDADARLIRDFIEARSPRPALRLVKEAADG